MKKLTATLIVFICTSALLSCLGQWKKHIISDEIGGSTNVDTADLDLDGKLDLVLPDFGHKNIYWFQNDFPQWNQHVVDQDARLTTFTYCGDFDKDDTVEIVSRLIPSDEQIVWYDNHYPEPWTKHYVDETPENNPDFILVYDINADGAPDIITLGNANAAGGDLIWYENKFPDWIPHIIDPSGPRGAAMLVSDLNVDSHPDVLVTEPHNDEVSWFINEGDDLTWTEFKIDDDLDLAWGISAGDINGDGKNDIAATTGGPYYDGGSVVWYENQHPEWVMHEIDTNLRGANWPELVDINKDGKLDLVVTANQCDSLVWYEKKGSEWVKYLIDNEVVSPRLFKTFDLDGDSYEDIVLASTVQFAWYQNPGQTAYAVFPEADPFLIEPGEDTLKIQTGMQNPQGHSMLVYAIIEGLQTDFKDSIILYDDGAHKDGEARDDLWGNYTLTGDFPEDVFEVNYVAYDSVTASSNDYLEPLHIITHPPVVFEEIEFVTEDTKFNPGDVLKTYFILKNTSSSATAMNIEAKLSIPDPEISTVARFLKYDDIGPGASSNPRSVAPISISCASEEYRDVSVIVDIYSFGQLCWTDTATIYIEESACTAVPGFNTHSFKIYPNPANSHVYIETDHSPVKTIEIASVSGQVVYREEVIGSEHKVNVTSLEQGLYFITVKTPELVRTEKLVKQ